MCKILFFNKNRTLSDPVKDRRGSWKFGMVVNVYEEDHTWSRLESKQRFLFEGGLDADWPGTFGIINCPGLAVAYMADIKEDQQCDDTGADHFGPHPDGMQHGPILCTYRRRAWIIDVDSMPAPIKNELADTGETTLSSGQINAFVLRIRDGAQRPGLSGSANAKGNGKG